METGSERDKYFTLSRTGADNVPRSVTVYPYTLSKEEAEKIIPLVRELERAMEAVNKRQQSS